MINESNSTINGDTIYVLPCLQELKTSGTLIGYEKEQQISMKGDTSDLFDAYWSGNIQTRDDNMTKDGLLTIPDCSKFGFNLKNIDYLNSRNYKNITTLGAKIPECGDFSCSQKWAIYTKFLKEKCVGDKNKHNVALLVTHHNRMTDSTQGLLPFKKNLFKTNPYNSYAINFCLKISIKQGVPTYELFFEGFPDKGEFNNCSDDDDDVTKGEEEEEDDDDDTSGEEEDGSGVGGGTVQYRGGKKKYKYFCNKNIEEFINTKLITDGITDANIDKNLDIYVIRHGNSLHNKPVSASSQEDRLDSSLTPLGMYQAKKLGEKLGNQLKNKNIILCTSFLQRAQLTGLLLVYYANINLESEMPAGMTDMLDKAIIKYATVAEKEKFTPTKFLGYSPLGEIIKYNNSKTYVPSDEECKKFIQFLKSDLLNLLLLKDETAKTVINNLITILEDNLDKNSGIQRPDGWKEIPGNVNRIGDDDDENDDGPRTPNKGGKKRRQTKKQRVMKSKKVRRVKKHNKKSKKVKRRSNKRKA